MYNCISVTFYVLLIVGVCVHDTSNCRILYGPFAFATLVCMFVKQHYIFIHYDTVTCLGYEYDYI